MAIPAKAIDLRRPEAEQTRVELTLGRIGENWGLYFRGDLYTQALLDFLRSLGSRETLRSYSYSILEFFDWYQRERGQLPPPNEVRRADAIAYARWLRERERGLGRWRLEHDPARRLDLAIYDVVAQNPGIDIGGIRKEVGALSTQFIRYHRGEPYLIIEHPEVGRPGGLARHLGCLVKLRTLRRRPTVGEYRRAEGKIVEPPAEIFRYFIPVVKTPKGAERASTIATRLSALSSLWTYFMRASAENVPGAAEPLLQHDIWLEPLKQARLQAPSHQAATRAKKTPDLDLFFQLLATTFYRTHGRGQRSLQAARAVFWGRPLPAPAKRVQPTFKDLRDRALLLLMAQTGVRSKEIHALKRRHVSGRPPSIEILGKRGKKRVIGTPPAVLQALVELSTKIAQISANQLRERGYSRAEELLSPEAPLLPAIAYWGANAGHAEQGLTRPGISQMLRRRALKAGIDVDSREFARVHPHGFRHLFVKTAIDSGTPINRVQAIVGHASASQTARYAEERAPEMLVAEVFRPAAAPPVASPVRRSPPALAEPAWEPEEEPIEPPAPPKPKPPPERPAPPAEEIAELAPEPSPESLLPAPTEVPAVAAPADRPPARVPTIAPPEPAEAAPPTDFEKEIQFIVRKRGRPLTNQERKSVAKCKGIADEALRNLCIIYDIHWGEEGNRQALVKSGGRPVGTGKEDEEGEALSPNVAEWELGEDEDLGGFEDFDEDEDQPTYEELIAAEAEVEPLEEELAEVERALVAAEAPKALYAEPGTVRTKRIYSGKLSGLPWWTGSTGKLQPAMPVMSVDQVGACAPSPDDQSPVCAGLVDLWRKWFSESPTKADALVRWVTEALDTAAQLQDVMAKRASRWVASDAPWPETKYLGTYKSPKKREVFREHLDGQVVAWFAKVAGQYRSSTGDPEGWTGPARAKVEDEQPPEWYTEDDPVLSLPFEERTEMLDWILALTGRLPEDTEPRFSLGGQLYRASRAQIAKWVNAMCNFDGKLATMREDERTTKKEGRKVGRIRVADLLKKDSVDDFPAYLRPEFRQLQEDVRLALLDATGGQHGDFDFYQAMRDRARLRRVGMSPTAKRVPRQALSTWYLQMVEKYFGSEAAADPAIRLVAKCGKVPLREHQELFNVERGTIRHSLDYKRHFAARFGVHSECVARRIARDLWEIKKRSPRGLYMTRPQFMNLLVKIERTFRVPCTPGQESELRMLTEFVDEPSALYSRWKRAATPPGAAREELTEAERQEEELQEKFEEERARMFAAEVVAPIGYERNPPISLPTPIHLVCALGL